MRSLSGKSRSSKNLSKAFLTEIPSTNSKMYGFLHSGNPEKFVHEKGAYVDAEVSERVQDFRVRKKETRGTETCKNLMI